MIHTAQRQRVAKSSVEDEESSKRVIEEQRERQRQVLNSARQQARAQENQPNRAGTQQAAQSVTVSQNVPVSREQLRTRTHQAMRELRPRYGTKQQAREAVIASLQSKINVSRDIASQYLCNCEHCDEDTREYDEDNDHEEEDDDDQDSE